MVIKTKYKLPVDDFYCLYYVSAILVIILITRRTQRSLIQAITCTYKENAGISHISIENLFNRVYMKDLH